MSGVGVVITRDDLSPLLQRVKDAAQIAGLSLVAARAIGILVKDHLVALNAQRHRFGRNYYARAARSVTAKGAGGLALVSVTQIGIRQRLYGGTIVPKNGGRFLTIPANPAAYGMRAREFSDLKVARVVNPDGRLQWALVRRASQAISFARRKQKDGSVKVTVRPGELRAGGEVMFWLVRKVTQRADPTVMPSRLEMATAGVAAAERRIMRLGSRAEGGPTS